MSEQMSIFDALPMTEWEELLLLPAQPEGVIWGYICPACGKHPTGGGGYSVKNPEGDRAASITWNACCGFRYARHYTPEAIARYAEFDATARDRSTS